MKKYIFPTLIIGLLCCNSRRNNSVSENNSNLDSLPFLKKESNRILNAFKGQYKNYQIIRFAKYSNKYVKLKSINDFPENSDIVLSFLKDSKNTLVYIQEQSETEDGNLTIGYYFNDRGLLFLNTIESFQFDNPCKDNIIRDLTYTKNIFFEETKVISNEEYLTTDKNLKISSSYCTFNGNTSCKIFKSVDSFFKENPNFQQSKLR